MTLTPAFLDELRARTQLSALIGRTTKLQRAGREWKACCPFHNEKTPSFTINDDKGFYHCFGCGAHGDAIRWMTDQRGLPFMDAVKELAQAAGMEVPAPDRASAQRAERQKGLHEAMADAAAFFTAELNGIAGAEARGVLERRGIKPETARAYGLGFAPDSRGRLRTHLKDYGDPLLVEAGLLIKVDDKEPYDRFRGRLMIPIRDARGRTIAFGGRVIGDGEPKYLNSPETPLFDKGRTLFNLDRAQAAARRAGRVIAVEGYMDVIALAQAGFEEAVAPLGTALTEHQLERLWRLADVPLLCFDGDAAGQKAAMRAAHRALPLLEPGRSLAFVTLPTGEDPDDVVRHRGAAAFEQMLRKTQPLVDRLWQHELAAEPLATPEQRAGLKRRLADLAGTIADRHVRDEYLAEFRHRFSEFGPARRAPAPAQRVRDRRSAPFRPGQWRPPEPPASDAARALHAGGIDPVLARAVLAGLIRHPAEIARHLEVLASFRIADARLARLFEAVVEVGAAEPVLDESDLVTILARSGFDRMAAELLRADALPFSFTSRSGDAERARADLDEAIQVMVARPAIDAALAEATAEMMRRLDGEALARQQALVAEQRALEARLANLMLADTDGNIA